MHVFTDFYQSLIVIFLGNAVYPCAYREHLTGPTPTQINAGLSLCIQGTLGGKYITLRKGRFIPVHTGNTVFVRNAR
jgi:hypothetical protein